MDITSYTDFNTEIDVGLLQDVESRLRMVLKKRWPELDTAPGSVFGDLFITPASRVVALIEQSTSCILSDLNLENALNGVVCDCDFIQTFLKGLGVTSLTDVNTTGMVRIHFTKDQEYTFDQGELLLFDDSYVFGFLPGDISQITIQQTNESTSTSGKVNNKKDLARIAMSYPHVYVAQVSLGANQQQVIKAMKEANEYNGPAIIIAYTPCISHGIKGGMENSIEMEKLATKCGYFPTFRYHPESGFTLDSKDVDFELYDSFLNSQTRYSMLKVVNNESAERLLIENKDNAKRTYNYYESLQNKE